MLNSFPLILTILLTKEVFCDNDTICEKLYIDQESSLIRKDCTIINGLTLRNIRDPNLLPLDNLRSVRTINGTLEILDCSFSHLNFLASLTRITGFIRFHNNPELLYVEDFFCQLIPEKLDKMREMRNNSKLCLNIEVREEWMKPKNCYRPEFYDIPSRDEVGKIGCAHQIKENCRYYHGNLILENIDENNRSELKKFTKVTSIIQGSLIIRNNTALRKLDFLSKLKEINPKSKIEPNETVAIQIEDNIDLNMNFHEISIISRHNLSDEKIIELDDEAQLWLIKDENFTTALPITITNESTVINEQINASLLIIVTTPSPPTKLMVVEQYHIISVKALGGLIIIFLLSAVLLLFFNIKVQKKIKKDKKSRTAFYEQTPTFSRMLEAAPVSVTPSSKTPAKRK